MKDTIDNVLRDEQAGFRKERSCADQIANLRIIVEHPSNGSHPSTRVSFILRRRLVVLTENQSRTYFSNLVSQ